MSFRVGVAGHRGYSGAELVRLLTRHPSTQPVLLDHREAAAEGPVYVTRPGMERVDLNTDVVRRQHLDLVFLATPPEVSLELAPRMLDAGAPVIDLSGAFRLATAERYARWYNAGHPHAALLAEAVYGLPEFYRERIAGARFIANPGCYPTAANLAIRPLIANGLVERSAGIICDAKSGVSGAGRKASLKTSFCEVTENFSVYGGRTHRHVPEVLMNSCLEESEFSFTAQLLPLDRGILETIYFRTAQGVNPDEIADAYLASYRTEPFIRLHAAGSFPDLRQVARTNFCDIGFELDEITGRGLVVTAIDNLGKGAAGQAIQNMNLMLGFPETEGLL
jgi:N-acetyl-gamma-glutamyl-phosphate reductase